MATIACGSLFVHGMATEGVAGDAVDVNFRLCCWVAVSVSCVEGG